MICHQYLIRHPEFPFAIGERLGKFLFRLNTAITAFGTDKTFIVFRVRSLVETGFSCGAATLRRELKACKVPTGIFGVYGQSRLREEIISFAQKKPQGSIEALGTTAPA